MSFSSKFLPASLRLAVQKVRDEGTDAGGCLAVPVRGVPRASSTPRPCGRQLSAGPLLTSVPDGLPAVNPDRASLQTPGRGPLPSQDEASTLACRARTGRARRTPDSVPAEDHSAGGERGLTARPSPANRRRLPLMGFSSLGRRSLIHSRRFYTTPMRFTSPRRSVRPASPHGPRARPGPGAASKSGR